MDARDFEYRTDRPATGSDLLVLLLFTAMMVFPALIALIDYSF